jgi:beta-glucanase (GH16 family)
MPQDSVYGAWPMSGEIDIAEARGNGPDYNGGVGGRDTYLSTIHWGNLTHQFCFGSVLTSLQVLPTQAMPTIWQTGAGN